MSITLKKYGVFIDDLAVLVRDASIGATIGTSDTAVDEIVEIGVGFWCAEADDEGFAVVGAVIGVGVRYRGTSAVVVGGEAELFAVLGEGLKALGGAEAAVGVGRCEELSGVLLVEMCSLGLLVWAVWSTYFGSCGVREPWWSCIQSDAD